MLTTLKNQGYYLVVLSNCKTAYRKAHWEEFGMKRWFERFYDCESYGFRPKTEIVQDIIRNIQALSGDRRQKTGFGMCQILWQSVCRMSVWIC